MVKAIVLGRPIKGTKKMGAVFRELNLLLGLVLRLHLVTSRTRPKFFFKSGTEP